MSIPRLELLAALVGARLHATISSEFGSSLSQSVFWSDSTTALAWIHRKEQWGTLVANRVNEIAELTEGHVWRHVPGLKNPADLPSRGCCGRKLAESRWWEGPTWLKQPQECWPTNGTSEDEEEIASEKRKSVVSSMLVTEADNWYYRYFSKYNQIVRMIAWTRRFIYNTRNPAQKRSEELSCLEYQAAELVIIKLVQQESFSGVTEKRIVSLFPFVEDGVLRIKTKVAEREGDTRDFRHPILLPAHHPVVKRLILAKHQEACHVGTQGLLSLLRENYWILGDRRTVRSVVKGCTTCRRYDAKKIESGPVALPAQRVREAFAFEISGVDLAGPLYLKKGKKAWVCLFTCATYRAVHLELITSLSSESSIQGLRRFVARRGRPALIYSDNGLNFVGADNAFRSLDWNAIRKHSSAQKIEWKFNPPSAPWWGGRWERMIGVLKKLLRKVLAKAVLSYKELATVLCDCEAVINSRPLTYLSDSAEGPTPLTPSMFIQDIREVGVPDCDQVEARELRKRAKYRQHLCRALRKRFRSEYLGLLRHSYRKVSNRPIEVGEIVLIGNDNSKLLDWPLGIITELIPGKDGAVRLVKLRTASGQLLRPVQRLFPLEVKATPECCAAPDVLSDGNKLCSGGVINIQAKASAKNQEEQDHRKINEIVVTRSGRNVKVPERLIL